MTVASPDGFIKRSVATEEFAAIAAADENHEEWRFADRKIVVNPIAMFGFEVGDDFPESARQSAHPRSLLTPPNRERLCYLLALGHHSMMPAVLVGFNPPALIERKSCPSITRIGERA